MNRLIEREFGQPLTRWHVLGGIAGAGMIACIVFLALVIGGAR